MATGVPSKRLKADAPFRLDYEGTMPSDQVLALPHVQPMTWDAGPLIDGELHPGDNLGTMLWLLHERSMRGSIRCIDIDPPYATSQAFIDRETNPACEDTLRGAHDLGSCVAA